MAADPINMVVDQLVKVIHPFFVALGELRVARATDMLRQKSVCVVWGLW
jgi:hypothetical protein